MFVQPIKRVYEKDYLSTPYNQYSVYKSDFCAMDLWKSVQSLRMGRYYNYMGAGPILFDIDGHY